MLIDEWLQNCRDLLLNIIIIYIVGYLAIGHLFCQVLIKSHTHFTSKYNPLAQVHKNITTELYKNHKTISST